MDFLQSMVGQFALYTNLNGRSWAYRVASTFAVASQVAKANPRKVSFKKISSVSEAEKVEFQVEKYNDWASD